MFLWEIEIGGITMHIVAHTMIEAYSLAEVDYKERVTVSPYTDFEVAVKSIKKSVVIDTIAKES